MLMVVRIWISLSALLVGSGWVLSACHQLNRTGYGAVFGLTGLAWLVFRKKEPVLSGEKLNRLPPKFRRRFGRPLPLCFLLIALMSLAGGLLYVSTDTDGLGYRIPRVLHWLAHEQWHWIRTIDYRMNIAGCDFEWLFTPLILFTGTDHFVFLANLLPYLMLPGLSFSLFVGLGVRPRLAWWWMWLMAAGWCFAFQAGSTINDSMVAIYALAAVDLALRARKNNSSGDLWLSFLAAALVTGVKQTAIPLAFLWLIAAWPARGLFFRHRLAGAAMIPAGLLVSGLPIIAINLYQTGIWTGIPKDAVNMELHSPFWAVLGNTFCLTVQNLLPPFFPWANQWDAVMGGFVSTPLGSHFNTFEQFAYLKLSADDSNSGIGLGVCFLVIVSLVAACWSPAARQSGRPAGHQPAWQVTWLRIAPWILLVLFMAKVGTFQNARQLAPYYVLLFPALLLCRGVSSLPSQRWWRRLSILVMASTVVLVIGSRIRPMFPAKTLFSSLSIKYPHSRALATLANVYNFTTTFENIRNFFGKTLPKDGSTIGFLPEYGSPVEPALWMPLGRLKVERFFPDDTKDQMLAAGVHRFVVDEAVLRKKDRTLAQFSSQYNAKLIDQVACRFNPHAAPKNLYLFSIQSDAK